MIPRELEDELYDLHSRIFRGVDRASFIAYVIDSKGQHTWIQLYRGERGELGGYLAVHIYEREVDGVMTAIVRRLPFGLARIVAPSLLGFAVISTFTFTVDLACLSALRGGAGWPSHTASMGLLSTATKLPPAFSTAAFRWATPWAVCSQGS